MAGVVVLDCRPPLLPVSMDISGVDLLGAVVQWGDLLGLICLELGVAPLVDPGTDVEDEQPTPVGSPSPVVDRAVPLSASSGVDLELTRVLLKDSVLPVMVTPTVDPKWESSMTPAEYPVPPIPELSVVVSDPLEAASSAGPAGGESS